MVQGGHLRCIIVPVELNRWESELRLLHVVIDLFVEVVAHVGLENHREMVSVPLALTPSLIKSKGNEVNNGDLDHLLTLSRRMRVSR